MKYLRALILCFAACLLCCASRTARPKVAESPDVVLSAQLMQESVALVHQDSDGDWFAYCSGVWASPTTILTANHCVEDEANLLFITHEDRVEMFETPIIRHEAKVLKQDAEHDLALLSSTHQKASTFAVLAPVSPPIGSYVIVVGGPIGLTWTQMPGYVSAYRQSLNYLSEHDGPFMQLAAGIIGGHSGCGVFDTQGHLVGIVNMRSPAPYIGFAIHLDTVRKLLRS